ncbi:MAG: ATP-binding protein [Desulfobacterales bacterium]|nr:ATP-binding protein [Desulfobacterales bacterium]MDD4072425.1 ATP-binding protein [Desulfobacterales bacterium]MDD4393806.1 ATP-binding protein [Desulfobacterales bacterium]
MPNNLKHTGNKLKIAVASGKGGTGKTTVSANLAWAASARGLAVAYLDCDVEEPNGHIFLKPVIEQSRPAGHLIPKIDSVLCTGCGQCAKICQFNALLCLGQEVLVSPELCHSCGGCIRVCPEKAISEVSREIGRLDIGHSGKIRFVQGVLNVGEVMSPPVIKAVKEEGADTDLIIIDAPPGTSCPVIETIRDCDKVILVTDATPFGLHDLTLAVEVVRVMNLPFAVVINRCDIGNNQVLSWCKAEHIPVIAEIPDDRRIAEAYSRGEMIARALPEYQSTFTDLLNKILTDFPDTERHTS